MSSESLHSLSASELRCPEDDRALGPQEHSGNVWGMVISLVWEKCCLVLVQQQLEVWT